jgi:hypothetical protein
VADASAGIFYNDIENNALKEAMERARLMDVRKMGRKSCEIVDGFTSRRTVDKTYQSYRQWATCVT